MALNGSLVTDSERGTGGFCVGGPECIIQWPFSEKFEIHELSNYTKIHQKSLNR